MGYKWVPKFKIPIKYDFFPSNTKNIDIFKSKLGKIKPHVTWFECLKILTHKESQFVWLGEKVGGNV